MVLWWWFGGAGLLDDRCWMTDAALLSRRALKVKMLRVKGWLLRVVGLVNWKIEKLEDWKIGVG